MKKSKLPLNQIKFNTNVKKAYFHTECMWASFLKINHNLEDILKNSLRNNFKKQIRQSCIPEVAFAADKRSTHLPLRKNVLSLIIKCKIRKNIKRTTNHSHCPSGSKRVLHCLH